MNRTLARLVGTAVTMVAIFAFAGANMVYRALTAKGVGEACETNQCNSVFGEYCVYDGAGGFCAPQCESADECPSGWTCERPTEVNQYGGETESTVSFCMRPDPTVAGAVLASGEAVVSAADGPLAGVPVGTVCRYQQTAEDPATGFDSRWVLACGERVLYGDGDSGYGPRQESSWPEGLRASDPLTSSNDGDPSFVFQGSSITVRDDAAGPLGAYDLRLTVR